MQAYLDAHSLAWAPSTMRSEELRLGGVIDAVTGKPEVLWKALSHLAPYSRLTAWTRVTHFYAWCIDERLTSAPNPYKTFKRTNARLFKNAYVTKTPTVSYQEAYTRVLTIKDERVRGHACRLLLGGLRFTESLSEYQQEVIGKGNKKRRVFGPAEGHGVPYHTLRRALAKIGLCPHDLRKLCATELARQGLKEADLCKVMGWASFATAKAYIAPLQDEAIAQVFARIQGGLNETKSL
jgi:hypothetical protein